jgi:adenosine/AMP kinase
MVAESEAKRGVLGVIDDASPRGMEDEARVEARRALLRRIGYKR